MEAEQSSYYREYPVAFGQKREIVGVGQSDTANNTGGCAAIVFGYIRFWPKKYRVLPFLAIAHVRIQKGSLNENFLGPLIQGFHTNIIFTNLQGTGVNKAAWELGKHHVRKHLIASTSLDEGIQRSLRKAILPSHFHAGTSTVPVSLDDCFAVEIFKTLAFFDAHFSMLILRCSLLKVCFRTRSSAHSAFQSTSTTLNQFSVLKYVP